MPRSGSVAHARTIGTVTALPPSEAPTRARPAAYGARRIALTVVLVLALMALGLVAGRWQWGRYEAKSDAVHAQDRAAGLPVAPLSSVMTTDDVEPGDADWRTVTATGVLDPGDVVELRGRTVEGTATIQYLAWLRDAEGHAVLVNLGWTPRARPQAPQIPEGTVTVTGTVRALETDNGKQGTRITPTQMGSIDGEVFQAYLMVDSACASAGCLEGLEPVPLPNLSLGPHLSYAMQWWLLLVAAAPIAVMLTVRDARLERELLSESAATAKASASQAADRAPAAPPRPGSRRRASDEEIEDAL